MGAIVLVMNIREIRMLTGLSQAKFCKMYGIPLDTLKKWETGRESKNHRECPEYVKNMLLRLVEMDFEEVGELWKRKNSDGSMNR